MRLTVVSPGTDQLHALRTRWKVVVEKAGLAPGTSSERLGEIARSKGVPLDLLGADPVRDWAGSRTDDLDTTEANGSSIAVLAEYEDEGTVKRCLLAGDAHGDVLAEGIGRLALQRGENRLRVDAFKLPHHGSLANVTRELIESVDCRRYLFSSNGAHYQHPHREAVARVLTYGSPGASLHFNYRTRFNDFWDAPDVRRRYDYATAYGDGHLTVPL
jgi:beta-lactamase superfamily II metal-dependent hydrolase